METQKIVNLLNYSSNEEFARKEIVWHRKSTSK